MQFTILILILIFIFISTLFAIFHLFSIFYIQGNMKRIVPKPRYSYRTLYVRCSCCACVYRIHFQFGNLIIIIHLMILLFKICLFLLFAYLRHRVCQKNHGAKVLSLYLLNCLRMTDDNKLKATINHTTTKNEPILLYHLFMQIYVLPFCPFNLLTKQGRGRKLAECCKLLGVERTRWVIEFISFNCIF